ncbi:hypothetical protein O181_039359 [Austropuccinia psidii MF-1]|uniref:TLC domain-containing protein n=1 Tax=Austropuccinia psidii MF-1 TaxID=1389203 RepID=A0A9Q3HEH4_9BASI|nr:hypothetical protein [Austropuccinia psidii MF-1]
MSSSAVNFSHSTSLLGHLPSLPISLLSCFILQAFSRHILSPGLFPSYYNNLSKFTKFNWDTRVVAWVHAFYATFIALWVLVIHPNRFQSIHNDKLFGYHHHAMNLLSVSAGYFLWDVIVSLKMTLNGQGVGFLVHAVCCFVAFFFSRVFAGYFGFAFLLWEASTIFLNPHWFFDKVGMTGSKLQIYNGIVLLASFFFSRLVYGNYVSYQLVMSTLQDGVRQKAGARLLNTILTLDFLLSALNIYWFYQMITSVRKRFQPASKLRKKPTAKSL